MGNRCMGGVICENPKELDIKICIHFALATCSTCINFIFTHTSPTKLYSGLPLSSQQNTHAFTHYNFRSR